MDESSQKTCFQKIQVLSPFTASHTHSQCLPLLFALFEILKVDKNNASRCFLCLPAWVQLFLFHSDMESGMQANNKYASPHSAETLVQPLRSRVTAKVKMSTGCDRLLWRMKGRQCSPLSSWLLYIKWTKPGIFLSPHVLCFSSFSFVDQMCVNGTEVKKRNVVIHRGDQGYESH